MIASAMNQVAVQRRIYFQYYLIEGRRSGRRRRWLKAKVDAPLVAKKSVGELSNVSNGVGGGIVEQAIKKDTEA
jgi:hypothetical protein